jgi:hypothetical protein
MFTSSHHDSVDKHMISALVGDWHDPFDVPCFCRHVRPVDRVQGSLAPVH